MVKEEFKQIKSDKRTLGNFGKTIGIIIVFFGLLLFLFSNENETFKYYIIIGFSFLLAGIFMPSILKPINYLWMSFAIIVGSIMTRIILLFLFFILITPIGLIAKLSGKRFLKLSIIKSRKSYWQKKKINDIQNDNHEKQF